MGDMYARERDRGAHERGSTLASSRAVHRHAQHAPLYPPRVEGVMQLGSPSSVVGGNTSPTGVNAPHFPVYSPTHTFTNSQSGTTYTQQPQQSRQQHQELQNVGQSVSARASRPTPGSNFAALFPAPRATASITTTHSSARTSASSVVQSYHPSTGPVPTPAQVSRSAAHVHGNSQTYPTAYAYTRSQFPDSYGAPPPTPDSTSASPNAPSSLPSLANSVSSGSRPSSCAVSNAGDRPSPSSSASGAHSALHSLAPSESASSVSTTGTVTSVKTEQGFNPSLPASGLPLWPAFASTLPQRSLSPAPQQASLQSHCSPVDTAARLQAQRVSQYARQGTQFAFEEDQEDPEPELTLVNERQCDRQSACDGEEDIFRLQAHTTKVSPQLGLETTPYSYPPSTGSYQNLNNTYSGVANTLLTSFTPQSKLSLSNIPKRGGAVAHQQLLQLQYQQKLAQQQNYHNRFPLIQQSGKLFQIEEENTGTYHGDMDMDPMDSYDEDDLLSGLPSEGPYNPSSSQHGMYGHTGSMGPPGSASGPGGKKDDKQVRRRSSKACDQCRKSKCKCERSNDNEPCKSCIMLGTSCTFLGPSRKRGPPKGYIDAIESRLHQTEALVGILLALANPEKGPLGEEEPKPDERARSLLEDLRNNDPLAREIVERVDRGAYGTKGRRPNPNMTPSANNASGSSSKKQSASSGTSGDEHSSGSGGTEKVGGNTGKTAGESMPSIASMGGPPPSIQGRGRMVGLGQEMEMGGLLTAHPSNEWQDAVTERLKAAVRSRSIQQSGTSSSTGRPSLTIYPPGPARVTSTGQLSPEQSTSIGVGTARSGERERQRRRVSVSHVQGANLSQSPERPILSYPHGQSIGSTGAVPELTSPLTTTSTSRYSPPVAPTLSYASVDAFSDLATGAATAASSRVDSETGEDEEGITDAVGQLSLNEDAQVRFHGKASGLHLLGQKPRMDGRNKGGIWHFPKARVWPPVAPTSRSINLARVAEAEAAEREARARLPTREVQEQLLELYFTHVHPYLPIVHKEKFWEDYRAMQKDEDLHKFVTTAEQDRSSIAVSANDSRRSDHQTSLGDAKTAQSSSSNKSEAIVPPPRIPTLLLLAMFAISARYAPTAHGTTSSPFRKTSDTLNPDSATVELSRGSGNADAGAIAVTADSGNAGSGMLTSAEAQSSSPKVAAEPSADADPDADVDTVLPLPSSGHMWTAGDGYLERAKTILDRTYSSSRPSTCQALLLMGYREIGIGAMAQSWLYVGMAVRMAQDLGMHRSSDRWTRVDGPIFTSVEQQIRKRIWYACVVMDKYVSTYIGRPLSIFESDYDTQLPGIEEGEELELWQPHVSIPNTVMWDAAEDVPLAPFEPVPGKILSCFNESARLSSILAMIVQAIYAVKPVTSRHLEALQLERTLDRWYIELPVHLRYDTAVKDGRVPPPHVLTLHMQYWCAVLLLHRPFIRHYITMHQKQAADPDSPIEPEAHSAAQKNFDLCVSAANHITAIVSVYQEHFCLKRCAVFLSYYIFSAGIMHMTTMATNSSDPQAPLGLAKCMDALKRIEVVWPSAGRAWELLHGAKDDLRDHEPPFKTTARPRKRSAEEHVAINQAIAPSSQHAVRALTSLPPHVYSTGQGHNHYNNTIAIGDGDGESPLAYFTSYDRWSSDNSLGFPGGLSTSVLPQQYSTGFVDERSAPGMHRPQTVMVDGDRYSQYWSDYSLGQPTSILGSMYGMPIVPNQMNQAHSPQQSVPAHGSQPQHPQGQAPLYMDDQYNLFNPLPPP